MSLTGELFVEVLRHMIAKHDRPTLRETGAFGYRWTDSTQEGHCQDLREQYKGRIMLRLSPSYAPNLNPYEFM